MTTTLTLSILFQLVLSGLVWGGMVVLNLWIWQKSKAQSSLLMMIGSALIGAPLLLEGFGVSFGEGGPWLWVVGSVLVLIGFYLSVKPMVAAQLAALQAKVKSAASSVGHKDGGGTPPAAS